MRGLTDAVFAVLDRRLLRDDPRPVAVALSGGGDSLALTLMADAWARRAGRPLLILTVDHRLQAAGAAWAQACADVAARLGRPFRALAWTGEKPATGLPAAARRARHALLADAAREAGAQVILMGHTADDVAESGAMRRAGSTTPDPREWAPSPAWPEGRGLFVLRPLLGVRREALRAWLRSAGETWIEDPANADLRYARARARVAGPAAAEDATPPAPITLAQAVTERAGVLTLPRAALRAGRPADVGRLVGLACVCAGGGERRAAGVRLERLAQRLRGADAFVATLSGARVEADDGEVRFCREPGEAARGGLRPSRLSPACTTVWDGRFELLAGEGEARPLGGLAGKLSRPERAALRSLPPAARRGLPVIADSDGEIRCPALHGGAHSLVLDRLRAAAGLVTSEPA